VGIRKCHTNGILHLMCPRHKGGKLQCNNCSQTSQLNVHYKVLTNILVLHAVDILGDIGMVLGKEDWLLIIS
jgi:hypothetical protein